MKHIHLTTGGIGVRVETEQRQRRGVLRWRKKRRGKLTGIKRNLSCAPVWTSAPSISWTSAAGFCRRAVPISSERGLTGSMRSLPKSSGPAPHTIQQPPRLVRSGRGGYSFAGHACLGTQHGPDAKYSLVNCQRKALRPDGQIDIMKL